MLDGAKKNVKSKKLENYKW